MESFDPSLHNIPIEQIRELIEQYIPLEMCRCYGLLPLIKEGEKSPSILVGMMNPDDLEALDRLKRLLRSQELEMRRMAIAPEHYQQWIQQLLDENAQDLPQAQVVRFSLDDEVAAMTGSEELANEGEQDFDMALQGAETVSAIAIVNKILAKALQEGVSDIHIEPQAEHLRIRFRKDRFLSQAFPPLPHQIIPAVITCLKIIANLDISERRCPQNGRGRRLFQDRKFDLCVSTLPTRFGEKIVIRLQECAANPLKLEQLIQNPETRALVKTLLQCNIGLILVSSHPYSGGKNTLYAMLSECNTEVENVSSLEDRIEYDFPGVSQTQILQDKGMDYASCLNTLLNQDADIIFVDDIPDRITASTILDAARSCLVVAGLPIESSEQAINDLRLRGLEDWGIARSVVGIINQQLLRCVCSACRVVYRPGPEELGQFGVSTLSVNNTIVYAAKKPTQEERLTKTICSNCGGTGYQGQIAVHEVTIATEELQQLIARGSSTDEIRNAAIQAGMRTGLSQGLEFFLQGVTTLEEIERIFKKAPLNEF
jgi:type IV pilus assembly protein PilB